MLDGKIFIPVLQPVFPTAAFHIGIPKNPPPKPFFTIILPEDGKTTERLSRFLFKETATYYIYGHADAKTVVEMCERTLQAILQNPKIPIPDSDRRYLSIERVQSQMDEEHSAFEVTVTGSRMLPAIAEKQPVPKIMHVYNETGILKGGTEDGKDRDNPR